ncbi:MAG: ABC transporter permease subunit [Sutterella wadsworthensis]|jgi:hypothetical protein|nr:ABC transporter permease subunit [Sutterella wadsworthensis]MDU5054525.1 ABC transporter permease subunit [Sutterella wadsworthensis]
MLVAFIKRLLLLVPLVLGIGFLTFTLFTLSPSDPAEIAIRVNAMVPTPELIAQTRHELGLDLPFFERYWTWLTQCLSGDFGTSFVTRRPVAEEFADALPATLDLAFTSLLFLLIVCVPMGMVSSLREGEWPDRAVRSIVFFLSAMPAFWLGILLMSWLAVSWGLLPTSGMRSPLSIILPTVTLSLAYLPTYVRLIRTEMLTNHHENWVVATKAWGMPRAHIYWRLLLQSLRGSVTALGMSIPKLIAGAFVVETLFAWPGIGRLCVSAIFNRDIPIVQTYVLLLAALFVLFNLIADVLVVLLDPLRRKTGEGL